MSRAVQIDAIISGVIDPNTGLPAANGTVYFYEPGTSTGKNVWTEAAKSNAYTAYSLDAAGAAHIYGDGIYDVVVKNASGSTIYEWDGVRLRYPDCQITTISTAYTQDVDDDVIVLSSTATSAVTLTILDAADWEDKPLVVFNANATYSLTISPAGGTIDGDSSATLEPDCSAMTIFKAGNNFFSSGGSTAAITSTDGSARSAGVDEDGLYDSDPNFSTSYYMTGLSTATSKLICARIDIDYSSSGKIAVSISPSYGYGFAYPSAVTSAGIGVSESSNGIGLSSGGNYITITNSIAYPGTGNTPRFCGSLGATVPVYDLTTSGVPGFLVYYSTLELRLYYYEDGSSTNIINAVNSSGDDMTVFVTYAMTPEAY